MLARMSRIAAVATAVPSHAYPQAEITRALAGRILPAGASRTTRALLDRFHAAAQVERRHLALPLEQYAQLDGFGPANDAFISVGLDLGERVVSAALQKAGLAASDVDLIMAVSVTGIAAPSLDARLHSRLGLREDVRRIPVFGLGCVAGAAGVARLHEFLAGKPDGVAVLLSVELCSLTVQRDDTSTPNLVASGLFGDGAAAVVLVGEQRAAALPVAAVAGPQVVATRSRFYPDTEDVMGWDIGGSGFRIVLSASVADVVQQYLGDDVKHFLADHDLGPADIATWVAHPGGPKVLQAMQAALTLPEGALDLTWRSLAAVGNLSSASVLHVLHDTIAQRPGAPGEHGLMLAMGPGFCAELVLLRW